jgi:hypothetical protein
VRLAALGALEQELVESASTPYGSGEGDRYLGLELVIGELCDQVLPWVSGRRGETARTRALPTAMKLE